MARLPAQQLEQFERDGYLAADLERDTGRAPSQWADLVEEAGVDGFMAAIAWLKDEHGLGHFQARLVAETLRDR